MKIDLDALERGFRQQPNARATRAESLALVARIRELEAIGHWALPMIAQLSENDGDHLREILERGVVLP